MSQSPAFKAKEWVSFTEVTRDGKHGLTMTTKEGKLLKVVVGEFACIKVGRKDVYVPIDIVRPFAKLSHLTDVVNALITRSPEAKEVAS